MYTISLCLLGVFGFLAFKWLSWRASLWTEGDGQVGALSYVSAPMAVRPTVLGHSVPVGYRLSSLYFGCGLVDRTGTLDHGFPVELIDPLTDLAISDDLLSPGTVTRASAVSSMESLCLERAEEIVNRARAENRPIRLLWSGGIDSTAAAVALFKTIDPLQDQLEIYYSKHSVKEYKTFFNQFVTQYRHIKIKSIGDALGSDALLVTGEHGDQLFGSLKALSINWKLLNSPWQAGLRVELSKRLASSYRVDQVVDYLAPLVKRAPVPVYSLWDLLWWLNFSTKWQSVALRIPAIEASKKKPVLDIHQQFDLTEHFFRKDAFQLWALRHRRFAIDAGDWKTYKWPLKEFIYTYNNDKYYRKGKRKIASLNTVMNRPDRLAFKRRSLAIDAGGVVLLQQFDDSLRDELPHTAESTEQGGVSITYDRTLESDLWSDLGSSGE